MPTTVGILTFMSMIFLCPVELSMKKAFYLGASFILTLLLIRASYGEYRVAECGVHYEPVLYLGPRINTGSEIVYM